jgi:hypothetical protein
LQEQEQKPEQEPEQGRVLVLVQMEPVIELLATAAQLELPFAAR